MIRITNDMVLERFARFEVGDEVKHSDSLSEPEQRLVVRARDLRLLNDGDFGVSYDVVDVDGAMYLCVWDNEDLTAFNTEEI